jgi:hypothetical protein
MPRQKIKTRRGPSFLQRITRIRINPLVASFLGWGIAGVAVIAIAAVLISNLLVYNAFAVYLDGELIGHMPRNAANEELTSEEFHNHAVLSLQAARAGARVNVEQQVTIEPARAPIGERSLQSEMLSLLTRRFNYTIAATAIYVNGNREALMRTAIDLEHVESLLQQRWRNDYTVMAEFVEGWETRTEYVCPEEATFDSPEEAYWRLDRPTEQIYRHVVQDGENLSVLAVRFGTTVPTIMGDNNLTSVNVWVGDVLYIYTYLPLLSVRTFDDIRTMEPIEMPLEEIEMPEMPQGFTNVLQQGQPGQQASIVRIVRENGVERYRQTIEPEVIIEPITHIVQVGTGAGAVDVR